MRDEMLYNLRRKIDGDGLDCINLSDRRVYQVVLTHSCVI